MRNQRVRSQASETGRDISMDALIDDSPGPLKPNGNAYRIRVEGRLDELVFDYVDNLTLALVIAPTVRAVTTLTCDLADQEALVGLVNLLHDFGLALILVERLDRRP